MISVLFVCLGNICRSPAAESAFHDLVKKEGLEKNIIVDSAGTNGLHNGERADIRMIEQGRKRNLNINSISRQFLTPNDFLKFNYIVAMDSQNIRTLKGLDKQNLFSSKIFSMTDFNNGRNEEFVPDPYYGDIKDFELVLDIVQNCSKGLLLKIKQDYSL